MVYGAGLLNVTDGVSLATTLISMNGTTDYIGATGRAVGGGTLTVGKSELCIELVRIPHP